MAASFFLPLMRFLFFLVSIEVFRSISNMDLTSPVDRQNLRFCHLLNSNADMTSRCQEGAPDPLQYRTERKKLPDGERGGAFGCHPVKDVRWCSP